MASRHILFGILLVVTAGIQSKFADADEVDDSLIRDCAQEVNVLIDKAYKTTSDNFKGRINEKTATAGDLLAYVKQPVGASRNAVRAAENQGALLQLLAEKLTPTHHGPFNVTDLLTPNQMELISQLTGCISQFIPKVCTDSPYRTITGECNNRKYPSRGASNTGYKRLLPAEYEDGFSLPRGWTENKAFNGFSLPLARAVSNDIVQSPPESITLDEDRALMFMQWGQWTDHDIDLAAASPARLTFFNSVDCETSCVRESPCFPLKIPANDPRIKNQSDCIPFFRSAPVCKKGSQVREQINAITGYIDGSQIYGSDATTAEKLRNNTNQLGLMAINQNFTDNGLPFLPFDTVSEDMCITANVSAGIPCFNAGDQRNSEQPYLMSFHTLFVREHNRIATELHKLNPKWSGETLYQETRKIIGGILQKITYKDWLPLLLGSELPNVLPSYESYNESEDSSVANVFSIAFRMGHTLIQPYFYRLADKYLPYKPAPQTLLHKGFFGTWSVIQQGGIDPLLRGMMVNRAKLNSQNQLMIDELRDHLFELVRRIAFDLSAINMQRGRDHGLPGYNSWRRFCGLSAPRNQEELTSVLNNNELAKKFINLYGTPENIDIWIGGVAEPLVPGGRIGKLLTCLIGNQFRRGRDGDRFYYENPSVFTDAQRSAIENVTLARIICDNTEINEVPVNVFKGNSYPSDFVKCSEIPALNLMLWKEN